jgi:hypothetical protein
MNVPEQWRSYNCGDYCLSPLAVTGWWDRDGQCWYIEPAERVYEDPVREFLVIGRPGVDGIEWGTESIVRGSGLTTRSKTTSGRSRPPCRIYVRGTARGESRSKTPRSAADCEPVAN